MVTADADVLGADRAMSPYPPVPLTWYVVAEAVPASAAVVAAATIAVTASAAYVFLEADKVLPLHLRVEAPLCGGRLMSRGCAVLATCRRRWTVTRSD